MRVSIVKLIPKNKRSNHTLITVLQANDHSSDNNGYSVYKRAEEFNLAKIFMPNGTSISYDRATYFRAYEQYEFHGLAKLYPKLQKWAKMSNILMVRSSLKEDLIDTNNFTNHMKHYNLSHRSNLFIVDVDSIQRPERIHATDIKAQSKYIMEILNRIDPQSFPKGCTYIAQASSSAGLKPEIKLHLYLETRHKYSQKQFGNFVRTINMKYKEKEKTSIDLLDPALYHSRQPIYICDPIFTVSKHDPFITKSRIVYEASKRRPFAELPHPSDIGDLDTVIDISDKYLERVLDLQTGSPIITPRLQERLDVLKDPTKSTRTAVQSVFHTAYQSGFNIGTLEQMVVKEIQQVRPELPLKSSRKGEDSVESYIYEGKLVSVRNIHSNIYRDLPSKHGDTKIKEIKSQPWEEGSPFEGKLNLPEPPEENSITFIKASLGSGKTFTVKNWMKNQLKGTTFLAITNTIALVESNCAEFNGKSFNSSEVNSNDHIKAFASQEPLPNLTKDIFAVGDKVDVLSGTIQSIHKLASVERPFNTIFIDEADAVFNAILTCSTMTSSDPNVDRRAEAIEVLRNLFAKADRVILCDGDFSEEVVNGYLSLMGTKRNVFKVNHNDPIMQKHQAFTHPSVSSLWNQAYEDMLKGRRCLIVTDWGPKELLPRRNYIQKLGKVVACIHSKSKLDKVNARILTNNKKVYSHRHSKGLDDKVSEGLAALNIDVVLCSPSVTSGVDWHYFDSVFIINEHCSSPPSLRFQASRRCRRALEYHYYCKDVYYYANGFESTEYDVSDFAQKHYTCKLYKRTSREMNNYAANYRQYFINQGCRISYWENRTPPDPILMYEAKQEALQDHCDAIMRAKDSSDRPEDYNDAWEDKVSISELYEVGTDSLTDEMVLSFLRTDPKAKAEYFDRIAVDYAEALIECVVKQSHKPLLKAVVDNPRKFSHKTGEEPPRNEKKCLDMLKRCGLDISGETQIKDQLKYYKLYITNDKFKVLPEAIDILFNGEKQEVRDML